jgi:hypothetical protein
MVLSGGYTKASAGVIVESLVNLHAKLLGSQQAPPGPGPLAAPQQEQQVGQGQQQQAGGGSSRV